MSRPDPPINVVAVPYNASAHVQWDHPNNNGGYIYQYTVISTPGSQLVVTPGVNETNIFGLENGVSYTFQVIATNVYGDSILSASSNPITPIAKTLPTPPRFLASYPGNGAIRLTWKSPVDNGGETVVGYILTRLDTSEQVFVEASETETIVYSYEYLWEGLVNNAAYSFSIFCFTSLGNSIDAFFPTASPSPVPYPPTNLWIEASSNVKTLLTLHWTSSQTDSRILPVTSYTIISFPPLPNTPITVDSSYTSWLFTDLNPGVAYYFVMYATNPVGNSIDSNPSLPNQIIIDYQTPIYKPLVTGGNDPTVSGRMRYAYSIGRLRKSQYINYNSGAAFYT